MTEHRGTSFYNSCVKVPVDPCSRQPTPSYERPRLAKSCKDNYTDKTSKLNFVTGTEIIGESETSSPREIVDNFLEFLESIPDYGQVHHLSNEQFKQKVDYLKRKQKLLLKNLQNSLVDDEDTKGSGFTISKCDQSPNNQNTNDNNDLKLNGKKCYLEEFRTASPMLFPSEKFVCLMEDPNLLIDRYLDKDAKTVCNEKIHSIDNNWRMWNEFKSKDTVESDIDSVETRSLPASISKEWHPTVPKPFSFTLREEAEQYMVQVETENAQRKNSINSNKSPCRKRRIRPIPLTSKIPLYNKLIAEKEERSRMIREESAINLMSQVRPFRLECDRRAQRSLARSSPEIRSKSVNALTKFKAKPVPKNLFTTEIYDRMLEDEYYRHLQKRVRAAELMKSSCLPPSMARRERVKSTYTRIQDTKKSSNESIECRNSSQLSSSTSVPLERCRSAMSLLPVRGNNLAAILRCQMSREKLEREIKEKMEEKRREQALRLKESYVGRNPVWRALRSSARHDHERDLNIRTSLRRDEAREQAERHRLQMELMLDRVTQIPTLFERHSQTYQSLMNTQQKETPKSSQRKKKRMQHSQKSRNVDSYVDYENVCRPDSGSVISSCGTLWSASQSSKSSDASRASDKSTAKSQCSFSRKKGDRGQLKVSINETAELIEDQNENDELYGDQRSSSDDHDENTVHSDKHDVDSNVDST
ncbi:PREDICTED: protein FAM161A [Dufourea novaeangliae]|uniref:protein FAM161A n=1 Tax=Dufourea novaeangliae TaxID=178035 RepID=UPI000767D996|nr:PREDICTED: protein FAM161A [Dufourea novaeangliae]